nr:integrase, catalytic region, zinc finger, CCHC-type, peptidase aspartic, catalytic [Tanacetum cinerariifolium]
MVFGSEGVGLKWWGEVQEVLAPNWRKTINSTTVLKEYCAKFGVVKEKHDELIKESLLTKSHYEGLVKQKTKVIMDLKLKEENDIDKMLSMEKQLKFLNEFVYKKNQSIQTIHMMAPKTKDQFPAPTAKDMDILIKTCLMPLALKKQNDSFIFVHELKQEMHVDLKYVESLEKEIDELESDKAEFSNMYYMILQECVSNEVMCFYFLSLSDLDTLVELQCLYLHKVKECDYLAQKLSKQTESISKQVYTELLQRFAKLEKYSISLELALQKCKEQTKSVPKTNVSEGLSKPVTAHTLPQTVRQAVSNTNVLKPGMYQINNRTTITIAPQSPQTFRNTNPRMSTSTRVNHKTNVSRPQHRSNQMKDKVVPNNSQLKLKKTPVEDHPRIPSISNKIKSTTTCNDSLNSRTFNANTVCATCVKYLVDSDHFACVTKMLNEVNARTKKPNVVPISTRKPKGHANKSVATPHKKKVALKFTTQKPKSYYRILYEKTSKAWKWWIEQQCPSGYIWVFKTKMQWAPKARNENVQKRIVQLILFIVDSGYTKHMTSNLKLLCNFIEKYLGTVHFGNDQFAPILGYRDLVQGNITINRVHYIEGLNCNLFSVG